MKRHETPDTPKNEPKNDIPIFSPVATTTNNKSDKSPSFNLATFQGFQQQGNGINPFEVGKKTSSKLVEVSKDIHFELDINKRREKLVNNEFQSDIVFLVGEKKQKIFAHKLFLMLASEYFYSMFSGSFKEANSKEVDAMDIEPEIFLEILRYAYSEIVNLTARNVVELHVHSEKYLMTKLHESTTTYLNENIDKTNALAIYSQLNQNNNYEFPDLHEKCLAIIKSNPLFFFKHEDYYTLDKVSLETILRCENVNCSIDQLQHALSEWKKTHEEENVEELEEILKLKLYSYDCEKLFFYGETVKIAQSDPALFKFKLSEPILLYGLGLLIDPSLELPNTIFISITGKPKYIKSHQFLYDGKKSETIQVADVFFEEISLPANSAYEISVSFLKRSGYITAINCLKCEVPFITRDGYVYNVDIHNPTTKFNSFLSYLYYKKEKKPVTSKFEFLNVAQHAPLMFS